MAEKLNSRTWTAMNAGALLLAIAVGIIIGALTDEWVYALGSMLILYGAFGAATSGMRPGRENSFGPSDADAALALGCFLVGLGLACMVYGVMENILLTVAVVIIVVAVVGLMMTFKNKEVQR